MSSSKSELDASESEYDELLHIRVMQIMRQNQMNLSLTACLLNNYFTAYHDKNPPRTSRLEGFAWMMETLNTLGESHRIFRMDAYLFYQLHDILVR